GTSLCLGAPSTFQLVLSQNSGITGLVDLNGAHLSLTTGGSFGTTLAVDGNSILTVANGATLNLTGLVESPGNLGVDSGTIELSHANNTFSGGTTIYSGTLWVDANGAAGTGAITFKS